MKMNIGNLSHEADSDGDDFAAIFVDYFSPLANEKNPSESVSPEGTPRDAAVFGQSTEAVDESPNPSINPTIDIPNNLAGLYQALFQQLLEFMSLGTLMALNPGLMPARMIPIPSTLFNNTPNPPNKTMHKQSPFYTSAHPTTTRPPSSSPEAYASEQPSSANASPTKGLTSTPTNIDMQWPQGDVCYSVGTDDFQLGWAFQTINAYTIMDGGRRVIRKCMGLAKCKSCSFVARPINPETKKADELPKLPKYTCPKHPKELLQWIPCTGGSGKHTGQPCRVHATHYPKSGVVVVQHFGTHQHLKPVTKKPTPAAMKKLTEIVTMHPTIGASKLKYGHVGTNLEPITKLDPTFNNTDFVNYLRKKIVKQTGADGIQSSWPALLQFQKDSCRGGSFIIHTDLRPECAIIIMQNDYMRQVLHESPTACQTDTIEGEIIDPEFKGTINLHMTSKFDIIAG
ncbi:hypothetical protein (Partial), partial [Seminavis robusta]|eukprot:Sro3779_g351000.1 n/a (455) ;mRNA; f:3191-4556